MTYSSADLGYLKIKTEWREDGSGSAYAELVGVEWQGPPFTFIDERQVSFLVGYEKRNHELIEVGPYVLRRTSEYDWGRRGSYWLLVGQGEFYWLRWRLRQGLARLAGRLILTLAVWGLAEWPDPNRPPRWVDVVKRWRP